MKKLDEKVVCMFTQILDMDKGDEKKQEDNIQKKLEVNRKEQKRGRSKVYFFTHFRGLANKLVIVLC